MKKTAHGTDTPVERLSGPVERVTFDSEESGFCVLRTKVRGHLELVTVMGSAASITAGASTEMHDLVVLKARKHRIDN
jgi:exodeoxyribonuclease V alpha subunit